MSSKLDEFIKSYNTMTAQYAKQRVLHDELLRSTLVQMLHDGVAGETRLRGLICGRCLRIIPVCAIQDYLASWSTWSLMQGGGKHPRFREILECEYHKDIKL
ncbi:hypothetical protein CMI37_35705 [Candidatus Pacearchaeota archaeon]|nr:hypothetical protein [Candidatus Pacearchaeota archaeon]